MNPEEFRNYGHQLIDWIADYRRDLAQRPVLGPATPGSTRAALPRAAPEQGESPGAILADLERIILPGLLHWQHPRFHGYFPANADLSSVLGDFLSTGLGVIGLSWQSSPALTELEEVTTHWMRQALGLSTAWKGVIQDTASTATFVALLSAREKASNHSANGAGLQGEERPLVVYCSAQAHSSVDKAALLAGFGRANIRHIAEDANFALDPVALAAAITQDRAAGRVPAAIVATVGTTATTALDPIAAIAEIAQREKVWLHVDAAMAGAAMILPECRWMWQGIEGADSVIINAHKWLGVAFDCTLYYVRDPEHLVRVMATNPSYLQSSADGEVTNYRDWGLPLGRRFRALKLWFLLREQGIVALQQRLRRDLDNAQFLASEVAKDKDWRLLAPVTLQTLCLRHEPPGLTGEALEQHTQSWAARLNKSGRAYVTPAKLEGRWMVRISIGSLTTERTDIIALWQALRDVVKA